MIGIDPVIHCSGWLTISLETIDQPAHFRRAAPIRFGLLVPNLATRVAGIGEDRATALHDHAAAVTVPRRVIGGRTRDGVTG